MTYKGSDHKVVIAVMHWQESIDFGAETHLGSGSYEVFLSFCWAQLLKCWLWDSLVVQLLEKAYKDSDHTTMITVVHWPLGTKPLPGAKVVNAVLLPFNLVAIAYFALTAVSSMIVTWH